MVAFTDHFSSLAANYAEYRPTYPDTLFKWLAEISPLRNLVWDCATGNGQAARDLAKYFDKVIATDASDEQLKSAPQNPKITYRVAEAEHSGLADKSINLVTVAQAVHWFKLGEFYTEVQRVTKSGGALVLWSYEGMQFEEPAIDALVKDFYNGTIVSYWPSKRQYVKDHYRSLPFPFENEIPAPSFNMVMHWDLPHLTGYFRSWSAVKYFKQNEGFDPVERLEQDIKKLWDDPQKPKVITFPIHIRAARL